MDQRSVREQEDDELYFEAYDDMVKFFSEKTNCSVAQCEQAEADDMIATWIQQHPDDNHYIISTDSDFYQLLAPNVTQYNGTTDQVVTLEGFKDLKTGDATQTKRLVNQEGNRSRVPPLKSVLEVTVVIMCLVHIPVQG